MNKKPFKNLINKAATFRNSKPHSRGTINNLIQKQPAQNSTFYNDNDNECNNENLNLTNDVTLNDTTINSNDTTTATATATSSNHGNEKK